jgi:hypothetical protein
MLLFLWLLRIAGNLRAIIGCKNSMPLNQVLVLLPKIVLADQ